MSTPVKSRHHVEFVIPPRVVRSASGLFLGIFLLASLMLVVGGILLLAATGALWGLFL